MMDGVSAGAETLLADRLEVDTDPVAMLRLSLEQGWGDGLPLVPPTEERVRVYIAASGLPGSHVLAHLPPLRADCTIELVAINAVMAGAPAEAMPLLCAAICAMAAPAFELAGVNATTASVVPAMIVNGPIRNRLGIPYQTGCLGGVAGPAPAIGRALRLVIRNVAGQVAGITSESIFGQPGRVTGIVVGEWEENSPGPPLGERRGVAGDAVTMFGVLGTSNILDTIAETGQELLELIGKSIGYMGNNNFSQAAKFSEQLVAINPVWANEVIARDIPSFDDVRDIIFRAAAIAIDEFPAPLRPGLEQLGRVKPDGKVYLMQTPDDLHLIVCGGLGNLHSAMLPGYSNHLAVTKPIT